MDDIDSLFALFISDKLKSCLSPGALNYVPQCQMWHKQMGRGCRQLEWPFLQGPYP